MYLGRFLFHQKNSNLPQLHTTSETIWAIAPLQPIMGSDSCRKVFVSMWHNGTGLRFGSRTSHACFGHEPWNLWSRTYVSSATNSWDLKKTQVLILGKKCRFFTWYLLIEWHLEFEDLTQQTWQPGVIYVCPYVCFLSVTSSHPRVQPVYKTGCQTFLECSTQDLASACEHSPVPPWSGKIQSSVQRQRGERGSVGDWEASFLKLPFKYMTDYRFSEAARSSLRP